MPPDDCFCLETWLRYRYSKKRRKFKNTLIWRSSKMNRNENMLILHYLWKKLQTAKGKKRGAFDSYIENGNRKGNLKFLLKTSVYLTMNCFLNIFAWRLQNLKSTIFNQGTRFRDTLSGEERLCVTLRHVVTRDSHTIISMNYRMGSATVGNTRCCMGKLFLTGHLKALTSKNKWKKIANDFDRRWNFHNCLLFHNC